MRVPARRLTNDRSVMTDHSTSLEQMLLFGRKSEVTGPNGKPMLDRRRAFPQTNVQGHHDPDAEQFP